MRIYANQALKLSTRNAQNGASGARLPRLGFRATLRIANAIPSLSRAMFGHAKRPTEPVRHAAA